MKKELGRKFWLTIIGVAAIVLLGIAGQLLKKFAGLDDSLIKWAMTAIASLIFGGSATIAWEDAKRSARRE
jgi:hypothetical protein